MGSRSSQCQAAREGPFALIEGFLQETHLYLSSNVAKQTGDPRCDRETACQPSNGEV